MAQLKIKKGSREHLLQITKALIGRYPHSVLPGLHVMH